jgi:hypothetical protein
MKKEEDSSSSLSSSLYKFANIFNVTIRRIRDSKLPVNEKRILEGILKKLLESSNIIVSIGRHFDKIGNKPHLSNEDQKNLWQLDDLANRTRTDILLIEIDYLIRVKPTILSIIDNQAVKIIPDDNILIEVDIILKNLIEVSERVRNIVHSKVSWFEMQKNAKSTSILLESSRRLEKSSTWLLGATIVLICLTLILTIPTIMEYIFPP